MNAIIAIDDNGGLLFHHRRLSQDKVLRDKILEISGNHTLWMNEYTRKQFDKISGNMCVDESFMEKALPEDYCFVETFDPTDYYDRIEGVILFRWNRRYPSDRKLSVLPEKAGFIKRSTCEFVGSSHEKITQEEWVK